MSLALEAVEGPENLKCIKIRRGCCQKGAGDKHDFTIVSKSFLDIRILTSFLCVHLSFAASPIASGTT